MDHHARAFENVRRALVADRTFPDRVFVPGWDRFRFFDDLYMRQAEFVEVANRLLELDGGTCVCLVNADEGTNREIQPTALYLDRGATGDDFAPATHGSINWVACMVILAASSDKGEWCMYCEPTAEIGVIAFRSAGLFQRATELLVHLDARPPAMHLAEPSSWVWEQASTNPEYFETLVKKYADAIEAGA